MYTKKITGALPGNIWPLGKLWKHALLSIVQCYSTCEESTIQVEDNGGWLTSPVAH